MRQLLGSFGNFTQHPMKFIDCQFPGSSRRGCQHFIQKGACILLRSDTACLGCGSKTRFGLIAEFHLNRHGKSPVFIIHEIRMISSRTEFLASPYSLIFGSKFSFATSLNMMNTKKSTITTKATWYIRSFSS